VTLRASELAATLLSPGPEVVWPAVLRIALGAYFVPTGIGKFSNHDAYIRRFERWGLPEPSAFSYAIGTVEVVCGLLLVVGLLVRPAALVLAGNMVGAFVTAGRVDGMPHLVLNPLLFALFLMLATVGGGRWQLQRRL
jgi:putative oxidoreductase